MVGPTVSCTSKNVVLINMPIEKTEYSVSLNNNKKFNSLHIAIFTLRIGTEINA